MHCHYICLKVISKNAFLLVAHQTHGGDISCSAWKFICTDDDDGSLPSRETMVFCTLSVEL